MKLTTEPQGRQERPTQARERLEGSTSRHTHNVAPASAQAAGGGRISPNSHDRGQQGRG
jgi:hypothetical protein